jgi:shikimate dehydrogenase
VSGTIVFLIIVGFVLFNVVKKRIDFPNDSEVDDSQDIDRDESPMTHHQNTVGQSQPENQAESKSAGPSAKSPSTAAYSTYGNQGNRLFGIIGKPLEHSKSIVYFKQMFRENGINADYQNFEIDDISQLTEIIAKNPSLCGLNVTIPYKEDVIQYMDKLDDTARQIGAVNVIKILRTEDKVELIGYNTDAIGFIDSIRPIIGDRKKALILGTGGSSKAVKYGLDMLGIESRFVSRNSNFDILGYYELSPSIIEDSKIIVNCTPVGMWPNTSDYPAIPYADLTSEHLLYDVIYNPEETMFMQKGKYYGATVKNGYEMWQLQANATWNIWNEQ